VIGGFYIGEHHCILHALDNKKESLVVFNLVDFCNLPNHQNKISSYTVCYKLSLEILNHIILDYSMPSSLE